MEKAGKKWTLKKTILRENLEFVFSKNKKKCSQNATEEQILI